MGIILHNSASPELATKAAVLWDAVIMAHIADSGNMERPRFSGSPILATEPWSSAAKNWPIFDI